MRRPNLSVRGRIAVFVSCIVVLLCTMIAAAEEVSASTEQTSTSTQEIAASAQELAHTAADLNTLVSKFTVAAPATS